MWRGGSGGQGAGKHSGLAATAGWKGERRKAAELDPPAARHPMGVGRSQDTTLKQGWLIKLHCPTSSSHCLWWCMLGGRGRRDSRFLETCVDQKMLGSWGAGWKESTWSQTYVVWEGRSKVKERCYMLPIRRVGLQCTFICNRILTWPFGILSADW